MVKAQIKDGIVVNVIVVDPDNIPDWCYDWPTIEIGGIGWIWSGGVFTPPIDLEQVQLGLEITPTDTGENL
jgi:hypothetical protein